MKAFGKENPELGLRMENGEGTGWHLPQPLGSLIDEICPGPAVVLSQRSFPACWEQTGKPGLKHRM